MAWLKYAHGQNNDGGVSAFYDVLRDKWAPSYPETTGYIIPTLVAYGNVYADEDSRQAGLGMSEYLLEMQAPTGAIHGWAAGSPAYIFDTGQALFGWLVALRETNDQKYREALRRASDWIIAQQELDGYWIRHQYGGHVKVWDARVAWALLLVGQALNQPAYLDAGHRCLKWVLSQQTKDGWFNHLSLEPGRPPVTHTIAYTVEALLESGIQSDEEQYVQAARCTADVLLSRLRPDGYLNGRWTEGWRPQGRSVCLTGNAQMALSWLRLYEITGEKVYKQAGARSLSYVVSTQQLNSGWRPLQGAIAGSWPVWGQYLSWRYPNWAAKFFLDALMLYKRLNGDE